MDPTPFMNKELVRKTNSLELIPSENICSLNVLKAQGSIFQDKYAEGYPGKRYYGGNEVVDEVESLAISKAKELFGTPFANVQPHCGADANMAAYQAMIKPAEKLLGMALSHGGHLTHGAKFNASGKIYVASEYFVNRETMQIDYNDLARIASEVKPQLIVCGCSSYPRKLDFKSFSKIAKENNALLLADISHIAGLVAGNVHESPVGLADVITMTTHKTLRGPRGAIILSNETFGPKIDKAVFPGNQGGPFIHSILAKAVCLDEALQPEFKQYAKNVVENAQEMAKVFTDNGFSLVTGGTDNHLLLLDVSKNNLTGAQAQTTLESFGITANKNLLPYDSLPSTTTSGLRLGSPSLTSRGFNQQECGQVAQIISDILLGKSDSETTKKMIQKMANDHPPYVR